MNAILQTLSSGRKEEMVIQRLHPDDIRAIVEGFKEAIQQKEPYLNLEKIVELTGIPESTIYKNDMPRHKRGKTLLFKWSEVDAWIKGK
jgi:predicted DNA-binding transcriptional regulator AlpA